MVVTMGTIEDVLSIQQQIPEFDNPYTEVEYQHRLSSVNSLILIARVNTKPVGFKVGYELNHKVFYSWMGGVLPAFRQQHVAKKLAQQQEVWAKDNGYELIRFKTRNYLKSMLIFSLRNGFNIVEVIKKDYQS